jgi:diacylglycerol kinase (ATP)
MAKPGKTGIFRLIDAFNYSIKGLHAAWQNEAAIRQETMLILVAMPLAFFVGQSALQIIVLVSSVVFIFIVELINSAIENVVDRIGDEYHELSGRAKDIGSAAVLIALGLCAFNWVMIIVENFL